MRHYYIRHNFNFSQTPRQSWTVVLSASFSSFIRLAAMEFDGHAHRLFITLSVARLSSAAISDMLSSMCDLTLHLVDDR